MAWPSDNDPFVIIAAGVATAVVGFDGKRTVDPSGCFWPRAAEREGRLATRCGQSYLSEADPQKAGRSRTASYRQHGGHGLWS